MPRFRKKPVVIEAEQFFANRPPYPAGVLYDMMECADGLERPKRFRVETLEGVHQVSDGDWIITGVKGERYPCKPEIFAMTYEPVDDPIDVELDRQAREARAGGPDYPP